jgi:hypothetical protein
MFDFASIFGDTKSIVRGATGRGIPNITVAPQSKSKSPFSWAGLFGKATEFARASGVKMPMDSEIASLQAKRKELNSLKFRAQSISKTVNDILASRRSNPSSVAAAATLRKTCSQACAQADASLRLIDAAISDGVLAQEKMKYGTGAFKPSATFFTKKAVADRVFSLAKNRLMLVISASEAKQKQSFAQESLPSGVFNAAKGTVVEFGGTVSRGLVKTGTAVREAAEGASALTPYAKYAVPAGLALIGLYAFSLIPKSRD